MSAHLNVTYRPNDVILYPIPPTVLVDQALVPEFSKTLSIDTLIAELRQKGPLVAFGKIGPGNYASGTLFKMPEKICNVDIYGWSGQKGVAGQKAHVLVLGAEKNGDRETVLYTLCVSKTENQFSFLQKFAPDSTVGNVYAISLNIFRRYLINVYAPTSEKLQFLDRFLAKDASFFPALSEIERAYIDILCAIQPVASILDKKDVKASCKAIGQEIFNIYKAQSNGNSDSGRSAVERICNGIQRIAYDGIVRKQCIESAWNGIGDDVWIWNV